MSKSIEEQKREAVAKYLSQVNDCLTYGLPLLRYWKAVEANKIEEDLKRYKLLFTELKADGKTIKSAVSDVGDTAYYMMYIWNQCLCGLRGFDVDTSFTEASKNTLTPSKEPEKLIVLEAPKSEEPTS